MTITMEPSTALQKARRSRARSILGGLDFKRAILDLSQVGMTQRDIADRLLISQPRVAKVLAEAKALPPVPQGYSGASPYEVAERYAADEITREQMIKELTEWPYTSSPDHSEQLAKEWDAVLPQDPPGTFEEVGRAFDDGFINAEDYDIILDASVDYQAVPGH